MTEPVSPDHAGIWAASLWDDAASRWTEREGQDRNYRLHVVHPAIRKILRERFPDGGIRLLDLGCGDGSFLDDAENAALLRDGAYYGVDVSPELVGRAEEKHHGPGRTFGIADLAAPGDGLLPGGENAWNCALSVFVVQEMPDLTVFFERLWRIAAPGTCVIVVTVHSAFGGWLRDAGRMPEAGLDPGEDWRWAGRYPIVDEPREPFYLPYFHRTEEDYRAAFERAGFRIRDVRGIPDGDERARLRAEGISPFIPFETNAYWPRMAEGPSGMLILAERGEHPVESRRHRMLLPAVMTGGRSYEELREYFMGLLEKADAPLRLETYQGPETYDLDRVTYIIPPVTDANQRDHWNPGNIYVVRSGTVAIGRVFYTRSSGEYLVEELILARGDIFGEFEVPLSILGSPASWDGKLPPRFNMTYGAWASGPALNWAMAYPRYIPRESVARENARVAVHPFYIKSKNIRPETKAEVFIVPIERFEEILSANAGAAAWFLTDVLWKTRLYFEPPSEGYGRSPSDTIARLLIRIMAYRIRVGLVVREERDGRTVCRTFLGPAEWVKYGLGSFAALLMEQVRSGGNVREQRELDVFPREMEGHLRAAYHFPVKDLDDDMLRAMGCRPEVDRDDGRFGLLTGIRMELDDLDFFKEYLLERGE